MSNLILLTGPRGSGKTSRCTKLVCHARGNNLDVVGLLSPGIFHDGVKIGMDLYDIATGEQRTLARRHTQMSASIRIGEWCFDPETLDWGNQILSTLRNHELILLDELGPLEFERDLGLVEGLKLIDENRFRRAIVVIRPELLRLAQARWPGVDVVDASRVDSNLHMLEQDVV